jgi:hypothetical protein
MIGSRTMIYLVGAITAAATAATPMVSLAQDTTVRSVEQYTCKEVMRESGSSRETAIAFLHGYIIGRSGSSEFDLELLANQTDAFMDRCLDNPNDSALDTMAKIKG